MVPLVNAKMTIFFDTMHVRFPNIARLAEVSHRWRRPGGTPILTERLTSLSYIFLGFALPRALALLPLHT